MADEDDPKNFDHLWIWHGGKFIYRKFPYGYGKPVIMHHEAFPEIPRDEQEKTYRGRWHPHSNHVHVVVPQHATHREMPSMLAKEIDKQWPGTRVQMLFSAIHSMAQLFAAMGGEPVRLSHLSLAQTGQPITAKVHHGSPDARFAEEFDPNKKGYYKNNPEALPDNTKFISLHGGIRQGFKKTKGGIFLSDDPQVASSYARDDRAYDYQNSVPMTLTRHVSLKNPKVIDWGGKPWHGTDEHVKQAEAEGHDGIVIRNVRDMYSTLEGKGRKYNKAANNVVVFDPKAITMPPKEIDFATEDYRMASLFASIEAHHGSANIKRQGGFDGVFRRDVGPGGHKRTKGMDAIGTWFSKSEREAAFFGRHMTDKGTEGGAIVTADIDAKNPKTMTADEYKKWARDMRVEAGGGHDRGGAGVDADKVRKRLMDDGHDAIIIRGGGELDALPDKADWVVALDPSIIKVKRTNLDVHPDMGKRGGSKPEEYRWENFSADPVKNVFGFKVAIENPAGSIRSGTSKKGEPWSVTMRNDYGYIKGRNGADGEGLDVFIGPYPGSSNVYIIHQNDPDTGKFDEDKVVLGALDGEMAKSIYTSNYSDQRSFTMTEMPVETFRAAVKDRSGKFRWKKHPQTGVMFSAGEDFAAEPWWVRGNRKFVDQVSPHLERMKDHGDDHVILPKDMLEITGSQDWGPTKLGDLRRMVEEKKKSYNFAADNFPANFPIYPDLPAHKVRQLANTSAHKTARGIWNKKTGQTVWWDGSHGLHHQGRERAGWDQTSGKDMRSLMAMADGGRFISYMPLNDEEKKGAPESLNQLDAMDESRKPWGEQNMNEGFAAGQYRYPKLETLKSQIAGIRKEIDRGFKDQPHATAKEQEDTAWHQVISMEKLIEKNKAGKKVRPPNYSAGTAKPFSALKPTDADREFFLGSIENRSDHDVLNTAIDRHKYLKHRPNHKDSKRYRYELAHSLADLRRRGHRMSKNQEWRKFSAEPIHTMAQLFAVIGDPDRMVGQPRQMDQMEDYLSGDKLVDPIKAPAGLKPGPARKYVLNETMKHIGQVAKERPVVRKEWDLKSSLGRAQAVNAIENHTYDELQAQIARRKKQGRKYESFYNENITDPDRGTNKLLQDWAEPRYGRKLSPAEIKFVHVLSAYGSGGTDPSGDTVNGMKAFDEYMRTGRATGFSHLPKPMYKAPNWWREKGFDIPKPEEGKKENTIQAYRHKEGKGQWVPKGHPMSSGKPVLSNKKKARISKTYNVTGLREFNRVHDALGGDLDKTMEWMGTKHPWQEIERVIGKQAADKLVTHENLDKNSAGRTYGVFALSNNPKHGSYILNRWQNPETNTKDLWVARNMSRYFDEPNKGEPWDHTTKAGLNKRRILDESWGNVAKRMGLSLADVQERMWDTEKELYNIMGNRDTPAYTNLGVPRGKAIVEKSHPSPIQPAVSTRPRALRPG